MLTDYQFLVSEYVALKGKVSYHFALHGGLFSSYLAKLIVERYSTTKYGEVFHILDGDTGYVIPGIAVRACEEEPHTLKYVVFEG